jgi:hypothetical protein
MSDQPTRLWTSSDVRLITGLRTRHVEKLARAGEIPHLELPGGEIRFEPEVVLKWLEGFRRPAKKVAPTLSC